MAQRTNSDVIIYICKNCMPEGHGLPVQWTDNGVHVRIKELPCSGKIDVQYIFHALEGGTDGVCIIACPQGECTLTQGNYRAEVRVKTVQHLLEEIGLEPRRVELLHRSPDEPFDHLKGLINDAVRRFSNLVATAH